MNERSLLDSFCFFTSSIMLFVYSTAEPEELILTGIAAIDSMLVQVAVYCLVFFWFISLRELIEEYFISRRIKREEEE